MHPDIIDGYRLRDLQRTVSVNKAILTNDTSETILMIEDCGRRTLVHPKVADTYENSITVSWATDCDDTKQIEKLKVIKESDLHVITLKGGVSLKLKYLQSLPATIIIGAEDFGITSAALRDLGKSTIPVCLSEDKELMTKWVISDMKYTPVIYQPGAGKLTLIKPRTFEVVDAAAEGDTVMVSTEAEARRVADELLTKSHLDKYCGTMAREFKPTESNVQGMVMNEHKIMAEESKQEGVQLQVAKVAVESFAKMAS